MARRQVLRTKLSSLLVIVLVALPIAAMSAFAVFSASSVPNAAERVIVDLGRTQAWIAPGGVPGAGLWQAPTEPAWTGYPLNTDGTYAPPVGSPPADPTQALPKGTRTIETTEGGRVRVRSADGVALVAASTGAVWDPALTGRFTLVDGRRPTTGTEAMASPAALERLQLRLGDALELADDGTRYRIVGTLDAARYGDDEPYVFLPQDASSAQAVGGGERRWYLPDTPLSWADVEELNDAGVVALSREVVLDPPTVVRPEATFSNQADQQTLSLLMTISIGGAFGGYVVVMLAGAAFAVTARRQQRSLAIAAGVGASRRDLFRVVVLQGTVLGTVGGVIGAAAGVAVGIAVVHAIDDGSGVQPWGVHLPWGVLAGIVAFAVVVGTLSALLPARSVARTDAIGALRGARKPQRPTAARPLWGSILLLAGVSLTLAAALWLASISRADSGISGDSPLRTVPVWGLVLGPISAQIGILVSSRWLLWTTSRALSRLSTAARIASRDAAANAARTIPAFAAIGATVFLGVFAAATSAMSAEASARTWYYPAPAGSAWIEVQPLDQGSGPAPAQLDDTQLTAAMASADELAVSAGASATATILRPPTPWRYVDVEAVPSDATVTLGVLPADELRDPTESLSASGYIGDPANNLAVVADDEVETALGITLSDAERARYRAGAVIVVDARYARNGTVEIGTWPVADMYDGSAPSNVWKRTPEDPAASAALRSETRTPIVVDAPPQQVALAVSPATAAELALEARPTGLVAAFDTALDTATTDRLVALSQLAGTRDAAVYVSVSQGPPSPLSWLLPLGAVVAVLVVGASAVALGLARFERRPDDATLAAVGGTPALRRRIGFWQALIIAGFGALTGAVTGILPAIGTAIQSSGSQRLADVPWAGLIAAVVLLPLAIAAVNAIVPPRRPDLTRRTVIT
ncbi:FtsX-like permease family protein [Microbacterium sp. NPDC091313]